MLRCEADLWSLRNKCEIVFPVAAAAEEALQHLFLKDY
jgi:hypothetical protein